MLIDRWVGGRRRGRRVDGRSRRGLGSRGPIARVERPGRRARARDGCHRVHRRRRRRDRNDVVIQRALDEQEEPVRPVLRAQSRRDRLKRRRAQQATRRGGATETHHRPARRVPEPLRQEPPAGLLRRETRKSLSPTRRRPIHQIRRSRADRGPTGAHRPRPLRDTSGSRSCDGATQRRQARRRRRRTRDGTARGFRRNVQRAKGSAIRRAQSGEGRTHGETPRVAREAGGVGAEDEGARRAPRRLCEPRVHPRERRAEGFRRGVHGEDF